MNRNAELDLIVYGATGYTGRLVAEHLARRYGVGGEVKWAMAGRSRAKLEEVRDLIGAPKDTPLMEADADDPSSLGAMVSRTKAVITTVGPYQLYGSGLVAACAAAGTDYLDLTGEPNWIREMLDKHEEEAKRSGARLCFSCGFDSIPFELGVWFVQQEAKRVFGAPASRVKTRVRAMEGKFSGGTYASGQATMAAAARDPNLIAILMNPFALVPGFEGPQQPSAMAPELDADLGAWIAPFIMAAINSKNVHRSNALMGWPYGKDFVYDEAMLAGPGAEGEAAAKAMAAMATIGAMAGEAVPQPGEGPTREERENGFYDILQVAIGPDGRQVRTSVKGDMDPGYGSTSKMLAEAALCLISDPADPPGGVWMPGAAMRGRLVERLTANAGLTFTVES